MCAVLHMCRLGSGHGDAEEVKKHVYFQPIDFLELYDKKVGSYLCHILYVGMVYCVVGVVVMWWVWYSDSCSLQA